MIRLSELLEDQAIFKMHTDVEDATPANNFLYGGRI
jgi:hypothetical protein